MAASRPVAGAPIESAWGDQVHDAVVTAKGAIASGGTAVTASAAKLPLDTFVSGDPALVALATDEFIASVAGVWELSGSAGGSGYSGGATGQAYRYSVMVNGAAVASFSIPTYSSNGVSGGFHALLVLAAGDRVSLATTTVPAAGSMTVARTVFMLRAQALG